MISAIEQSGHVTYGLKKYVVDIEADLNDLPIDGIPGSMAYVIETGKKYILNGQHDWHELQPVNAGSGSGSGTSGDFIVDEPLSDDEIMGILI